MGKIPNATAAYNNYVLKYFLKLDKFNTLNIYDQSKQSISHI